MIPYDQYLSETIPSDLKLIRRGIEMLEACVARYQNAQMYRELFGWEQQRLAEELAELQKEKGHLAEVLAYKEAEKRGEVSPKVLPKPAYRTVSFQVRNEQGLQIGILQNLVILRGPSDNWLCRAIDTGDGEFSYRGEGRTHTAAILNWLAVRLGQTEESA